MASDKVVSIHARHYWRAMRGSGFTAAQAAQFQSTPAITGGRCLCFRPSCPQRSAFQSTPAITGGRCVLPHTRAGSASGFNPRPPLLAGDATAPPAHPHCRACFNPRPPLLAGDANGGRISLTGKHVSIHARHYWRAMRGSGYLRPARA